jgi:RNA polymerase sigma-70 factor (ECF subfamily)
LDPSSIEALVQASLAGDRDAYSEMIRRHYKSVYLQCYGVTGNSHDAEDLAQDAFLKGYTRLGQLKTASHYPAWIRQIARNLSLTCLRRKKTASHIHENLPEPETTRVTEPAFDDLRIAIGKLPAELRTPLVMFYFDGRDMPSVAKQLEISISNAYGRVRQAVKTLHAMLTEQGGEL